MFDKIVNPTNNKSVLISSHKGKNILKKYVLQSGGNLLENISRKINFEIGQKINKIFIKETQIYMKSLIHIYKSQGKLTKETYITKIMPHGILGSGLCIQTSGSVLTLISHYYKFNKGIKINFLNSGLTAKLCKAVANILEMSHYFGIIKLYDGEHEIGDIIIDPTWLQAFYKCGNLVNMEIIDQLSLYPSYFVGTYRQLQKKGGRVCQHHTSITNRTKCLQDTEQLKWWKNQLQLSLFR